MVGGTRIVEQHTDECRIVTMRKVQSLAVAYTLAFAIPFTLLALSGVVYLTDYTNGIAGAVTGVIDWHSLALEGSARWPEIVGMVVGQLLILSMLLIARRGNHGDDDSLVTTRPELTILQRQAQGKTPSL
jgi:hypothetical protein